MRELRPLLEKLGARYAFGRVELGVRIEAASSHPLFEKLPGVDGKLVFAEEDLDALEIRTFATCRDGEVVLCHADGMRAFSGRADGPATGRSNVGLVVRSTSPAFGRAVEAMFRTEPACFALGDWIDAGAAFMTPAFGEVGARALWRALERLRDHVPELAGLPATVYSPVIEGIGDYPADDGSLQVAPGVWVAGDAQGRFRGIVASLISGGYVARRILAARGASL
jgi:hypothetical protein